jgi:hypothetical protein
MTRGEKCKKPFCAWCSSEFYAIRVERNRQMSDTEIIDLFLQLFEGLAIMGEQSELLECVFGGEEMLPPVSLSQRDESTKKRSSSSTRPTV